jgi:hypothetical protein
MDFLLSASGCCLQCHELAYPLTRYFTRERFCQWAVVQETVEFQAKLNKIITKVVKT